ncbi:MAG: hypothetical protein Q8R00_03845 [Candidatus Nanoarchaeia archaeon]|nr:hypothetical protein [Candidatus Nanoarchaeia archaeon]
MATIYQAVFPVNPNRTFEDLANIVGTWITGSPHRNLSAESLEGLAKEDFNYNSQAIGVLNATYNTSFGVRLMERDKDSLRTTDVVGQKQDGSFNVAVVHDFETKKIGNGTRGLLKPRIVNDLVRSFGGAYDGKILRVKAEPYSINEEDLEFIVELINNRADNNLPILYISRERSGYIVRSEELAKNLSGMAHVLVEPSINFSYQLRKATNGRNIFGGAVGIYWPNGRREYLLPNVSQVADKIYRMVEEEALFTLLPKELTFDGIINLKVAEKLEELRSSKKISPEEALNLAIDQIDSKELEVKKLEKHINTLEARLAKKSKYTTDGELLVSPQISELYQGELSDMVIKAIEQARDTVQKDSRRCDLLSEVLKLNTETGERETLVGALNKIFKTADRKVTGSMISELQKLGFVVEHGSKHIHIYVPGHEGRKCTVPKTPSDYRSFKNSLSQIKNTLI